MDAVDLLSRILFKRAARLIFEAEPVREKPAAAWGRCVSCGLTLPWDRLRDGKCPTCFWEEERRVKQTIESPRERTLREAYAVTSQ